MRKAEDLIKNREMARATLSQIRKELKTKQVIKFSADIEHDVMPAIMFDEWPGFKWPSEITIKIKYK